MAFSLNRGRDDHDPKMVLSGDSVAREFCDDHPGHPQHGTGWRDGLQSAAERSDLEPEIPRIADELHAIAIHPPTAAALQRYVDQNCWEVESPLARAFTMGMIGHLNERSDRADRWLETPKPPGPRR